MSLFDDIPPVNASKGGNGVARKRSSDESPDDDVPATKLSKSWGNSLYT